MHEVVLSIEVMEPAQEAAFVLAIDKFARWREETRGQGWKQRSAPDLMIKTICDFDGRLKKSVTFQDGRWADTFMQMWQEQQAELSA